MDVFGSLESDTESQCKFILAWIMVIGFVNKLAKFAKLRLQTQLGKVYVNKSQQNKRTREKVNLYNFLGEHG